MYNVSTHSRANCEDCPTRAPLSSHHARALGSGLLHHTRAPLARLQALHAQRALARVERPPRAQGIT